MELTFFNSHFLSLFCEDGCKEPSGTILRGTSAKSNLVKKLHTVMTVHTRQKNGPNWRVESHLLTYSLVSVE